MPQPASAGADYRAVTRAHRGLYWTVDPVALHPAALAHATLGCTLLPNASGPTRRAIAAALAESYLLAGRIEFFDLREPDRASATWLRALQAAGEADDALLGASVLGHMAFVPGWSGNPGEAAERLRAARAYARRGRAPALFLAWLDAVEAECETRSGSKRTALNLLRRADDTLSGAAGQDNPPEWFNWFSPARLAAFRGNTELRAGHLPQARTTLLSALEMLPSAEEKQRSVILGDLAAVEAAAGNPAEACQYAIDALDQLARTWYATGMERVREVRRALTEYQDQQCVLDLDERLYGWATTVSALAR